MAYAPGAGATRTPSRSPGSRHQGNGKPGSRSPAIRPPAGGRRPTVTFLAGLGIGLAVGAAAALLFAPRSGSETRKALRNRGRKVGNRARDAWDDLRIELEATRRALKRKRRDAKVEIEEEAIG
jgi:hypothetical protein